MEAQKKRKKSKAQLGNDASLDILSTFSTPSTLSNVNIGLPSKQIFEYCPFSPFEKKTGKRQTIFPSIHPTDASKKNKAQQANDASEWH